VGARDKPGDDDTGFVPVTHLIALRNGAIRFDIVRKDRAWIGSSSSSSSRSSTSTGLRPSTPSIGLQCHDHVVSDELRFVQLTPPGSGCSIAVGKGLIDTTPGSLKGVHSSSMTSRSLTPAPRPRRRRERRPGLPWGRFVFFRDPDGNAWSVQQLPPRP